MRFFKRKNDKEKEGKDNPEIQNMIQALKNQIDSQEAQIITFKEDIAPQMADTIKTLEAEVERLEKISIEKDIKIVEQRELIQRIRSYSAALQDERTAGLQNQSQDETIVYKNQIIEQSKRILEQSKKIEELQKQVDLLPVICTRLVDEMNQRNVKIQNLLNQLDKVKAENIRLSLGITELESKLEKTLKSMEDKELRTRRALSTIEL